MKLEKNTRAYRAYENGKKAYNAGKPIDDTPYISSKKAGLNSWFIKGWLEAQSRYQRITDKAWITPSPGAFE